MSRLRRLLAWCWSPPPELDEPPLGDTFTDDYGQVVFNVHDPALCVGQACVIHNPSDHALRHLPLRWRQCFPVIDIKPSHFERICEHGVGHPDPDSVAFFESIGEECMGVHGCDGCCRAA